MKWKAYLLEACQNFMSLKYKGFGNASINMNIIMTAKTPVNSDLFLGFVSHQSI